MRCLIVIPDWSSGSGACSRAIAKEMISQDHEVYLLSRKEIKEQDLKSESYFSKKGGQSRLWLSIKRIAMYPVWPLFSLQELLCIYKNAKRIVEEHDIEVLISVYNPIENLIAGHLLKKKKPQLNFVPYFLDALFAGSTPKLMPLWIKKAMAVRWENLLLSNADLVVMMKAAEPLYKANLHLFSNYKKIKFLDLPLYEPKKNLPDVKERVIFPKGQIVLLFAGALPLNVRNPKYLLDVVKLVTSDDIHLYLAGSGDYDIVIEKAARVCKNIHYLGQVVYDDILKMYLEADILVNIGNTLGNMVPSKIFEYMSYAKPIVSTVKIADDPCLPYLEKYDRVLLLNEQDDAHEGATQLVEFIHSQRDLTDTFKGENLFVLNRPETFVSEIKKLIKNEKA